MRHVTYAEKSLFVDDETADLLIEYAKIVAGNDGSDTVTIPAVGSDGNLVKATFLLTVSTVLIVETAQAEGAPPHDESVVADLRARIQRATAVNVAQPEQDGPEVDVDEFD